MSVDRSGRAVERLAKVSFTAFWLLLTACGSNHGAETVPAAAPAKALADKAADVPEAPVWNKPRTDARTTERDGMVEVIRKRYNFKDERVLEALGRVPRHWFVPEARQAAAYADSPLPIGHGQTISQPYIVAFMTSVLKLDEKKKVLEVGTGSGYQAAVLNEFTPHVYTIEIVKPLAASVQELFRKRGYTSITAKQGDGYVGWEEHQPFDAVIVTCSPDHVPPKLLEQLKPGGRLIIPVGDQWTGQELVLLEKTAEGTITRKNLMPVRFVPLLREN